jgi:predicted negative regulator of RcsB-dependent stress response
MSKKNFLPIMLLLIVCGSLHADFLDDFQAAAKLQKNRKYPEAAAAFEQLGKAQKDAKLAEICQLNAVKALAAGRKFDDALTAAKAIATPEIREYAEMHTYAACGKGRELKVKFKDTDISRWPDQYAYLGYHMRGSASPRAAGLKDLELALEGCGSDWTTRDVILRELGERYVLLGRNEQAHAVLDRLIAEGAKGRSPYLAGIRAKAVLLAKEKKFDEAEQMLARIDSKGVWKEKLQHFWFVITKAKIEAAKGNLADAEKLYDEAFAMKGIPLPVIRFQKIEAGRTCPKYKVKK